MLEKSRNNTMCGNTFIDLSENLERAIDQVCACVCVCVLVDVCVDVMSCSIMCCSGSLSINRYLSPLLVPTLSTAPLPHPIPRPPSSLLVLITLWIPFAYVLFKHTMPASCLLGVHAELQLENRICSIPQTSSVPL